MGSLLACVNLSEGAYIGGSLFYQAVYPKIHWTDPWARWFSDSITRFDASVGNVYSDYPKDVEGKEAFFNQIVLARNEDRVVFDKWMFGTGGSLWFGNRKNLPDRFFIGYEITISYMPRKFKENISKETLLQFENPTFFYRHGLFGDSTYSARIKNKEALSAHFDLCLGFSPVPKISMVLKLGVSLHHYTFDPFYISVDNNVRVIRYDDPNQGNQDLLILEPIPEKVEYRLSDDHYFSGAVDLGVGCEFLRKFNWFVRVEYVMSFLFANHLHAFSDQKIDYDQPKFEHALKYQSVNNCFSWGIGKKF